MKSNLLKKTYQTKPGHTKNTTEACAMTMKKVLLLKHLSLSLSCLWQCIVCFCKDIHEIRCVETYVIMCVDSLFLLCDYHEICRSLACKLQHMLSYAFQSDRLSYI